MHKRCENENAEDIESAMEKSVEATKGNKNWVRQREWRGAWESWKAVMTRKSHQEERRQLIFYFSQFNNSLFFRILTMMTFYVNRDKMCWAIGNRLAVGTDLTSSNPLAAASKPAIN